MKTAIAIIVTALLFVIYGNTLRNEKPDTRAATTAANAERAREAELAAIADRAIAEAMAEAMAEDVRAQQQQAQINALHAIEYELSIIRLEQQMRPTR